MKIKIKKLTKTAKLPKYALPGDAGMDLFAREKLILKPGEEKVIWVGIAMAIPYGYVGLVWDKGGIGKKGIKTLGGVVDSNYRGEVCCLLMNLSKEKYVIEKGDKVAQLIIQKMEIPTFVEVDDLDDSSRGEKCFGSTGLR